MNDMEERARSTAQVALTLAQYELRCMAIARQRDEAVAMLRRVTDTLALALDDAGTLGSVAPAVTESRALLVRLAPACGMCGETNGHKELCDEYLPDSEVSHG